MKRLSQVNTVNVTTSRVTDTRVNFVLVRAMGSVSVETASVRVSGMWRGSQHVSARPATTPVSHHTGNTWVRFAQGMASAGVGSVSAKNMKIVIIQENTANTAQPVQENVMS